MFTISVVRLEYVMRFVKQTACRIIPQYNRLCYTMIILGMRCTCGRLIKYYYQGHREFPIGNSREYVFRKIPAGILGNFAPFCIQYFSILISSLDKCSYNARHNVKVHCNFVDSVEILKKFVS